MRAGHVVQIRVNPKDCQSLLDLMELVGIDPRPLSFPQIVSLGLSTLLENARTNSRLPEPDEFQYLPRMQQWLGKGRGNQRKARIASSLHDLGGNFKAPVMPAEGPGPVSEAEPLHATADASQQTATPEMVARLSWLARQQEERELTMSETLEFTKLERIVYS